jgi:signal transduction histidine kinase
MDRGRALGVIHLGRDLRGPLFSHAELDSVTSFAAAAEVIGRVRERASWRAVDTAVAEERSRIARDLHDTVIQRLFVTGLGLQAIGSANPLVDDAIEVQTNQIDAAIGDLRAAVSELATGVASGAPRDVRDSVVQELADLAASAGTAPRVVFAVPPNRALPPAIVDDILAVVREGAANILRHARSRWSEVTIEVDDAAATVVLEDDGVGIRANARRSGISNLEERALRHGGTFEVRRREGGGTRVRWRVPLGSAPA